MRETTICLVCGKPIWRYRPQVQAAPGEGVPMIPAAHDYAPGSRAHGRTGAEDPNPLGRPGPVINILHPLGACLRHLPRSRVSRLRAEVAALRREIAGDFDALDRGVVEAGTTASRAIGCTEKLLRYIQEQATRAGLPVPDEDSAASPPTEAQARERAGMAPGHPEWLTRELDDAGDTLLGALCVELWPDDEYEDITADGGGETGTTP
jgi:hypothetical protein